MDTDRLNRWLTLGANVGVLAGIILLVFELNQNRDMIQAQTRNEIWRGAAEVLILTAENPHLADIVARSNRGEELSDADNVMYLSRTEAVFRYWENAHYQYRKGMYDEAEYSKHLETMRVILAANPGVVSYWCQRRTMFSAVYMAEIDSMLPSNSC